MRNRAARACTHHGGRQRHGAQQRHARRVAQRVGGGGHLLRQHGVGAEHDRAGPARRLRQRQQAREQRRQVRERLAAPRLRRDNGVLPLQHRRRGERLRRARRAAVSIATPKPDCAHRRARHAGGTRLDGGRRGKAQRAQRGRHRLGDAGARKRQRAGIRRRSARVGGCLRASARARRRSSASALSSACRARQQRLAERRSRAVRARWRRPCRARRAASWRAPQRRQRDACQAPDAQATAREHQRRSVGSGCSCTGGRQCACCASLHRPTAALQHARAPRVQLCGTLRVAAAWL
jgi:hypothetical protein